MRCHNVAIIVDTHCTHFAEMNFLDLTECGLNVAGPDNRGHAPPLRRHQLRRRYDPDDPQQSE